jgi:uncharacterized protein
MNTSQSFYIPRFLSQEILQMSQNYPILTLTGPRQSGKTALVKKLFPEKPYINLESPDERAKVMNDPRGILSRYPEGAIFDEVQRFPDLLSYLQVHVDEVKKNGLFVLTGSHQLMLHEAISQSLAGRTALLQLLPLSMAELENYSEDSLNLDLDQRIIKGFYPRLYQPDATTLSPTKFHRDYLQTYVERDVRMLINLKDLHVFQNFIRLCAGRIGQLVNYDNLSNELGVSSHTVKHWLSILEASFIIFTLQPYHENIGKRLTKSAKIYFTDVGLASYLLGIETPEQLSRDPVRGHLVENLVVLEVLKAKLNQGQRPELYFFRDQQGHEVDLLIKKGREFIPCEIKASQTFHEDFLSGLKFFNKLFGSERIQESYLIYSGVSESLGEHQLLNYKKASTVVIS